MTEDMRERFENDPALKALRQWEADTESPASASEGNAFIDGFHAGQAALSSAGTSDYAKGGGGRTCYLPVGHGGRRFVFCVFGADGCECDSLEAVFDDDKAAIQYAENLLKTYNEHEYTFYGEPDLLEVRQIEIGKKIDVLQPTVIWTAREVRS